MDYEQEYMPSRWNHQNLSPDDVLVKHCRVTAGESKKAREELAFVADIRYGSTRKNAMDVYLPRGDVRTGMPLFAYIHGGYWNFLNKTDSAYFARTICQIQGGAVFVALDYVLASEKEFGDKASMKEIWNEMKGAYKALAAVADEMECSGIYLCGHSAGAHLAAAMISQSDSGGSQDAFRNFRGIWLLSGIFDLEPILRTSVNDPLQMTNEEVIKCSPLHNIDQLLNNLDGCSAVVKFFFGQFDPPAFHRQTRLFYEKLKATHRTYLEHGKLNGLTIASPVEVPERDHFDLVDDVSLDDNKVLQDIVTYLTRDLPPGFDYESRKKVERDSDTLEKGLRLCVKKIVIA